LSSVFKAKSLRPADKDKEFAVKKIDVKRDTPVETRVATYRAFTEARIAKSRCGHEDGAVYTVAKLVRPGNLLKAVTKLGLARRFCRESHVASIVKDILSGLGHIRGQGLLHRDMNTANVLLGADGVCMIVDFGESATGGSQRGTGVGTDGYRPPEAWGDEKQTKALDVYLLGIIAAECMAMRGKPQYYEDDPPHGVIAWVRKFLGYSNRRPPSPEFEDFLEKCLQYDAAARPTVAALLEHPFVKLADRSSLKEIVAYII
ncbi:cAMP-dependent protein kinase catalytic subunit, partial [Aphelenchoides avenae]